MYEQELQHQRIQRMFQEELSKGEQSINAKIEEAINNDKFILKIIEAINRRQLR